MLVLCAELSVAVAGFSGVIVALESRGVRTWSPLRRRDLRVLLQLSGLALAFSILPLIAYPLVGGSAFWKWGLGLYGLAHLVDVSSFLLRQPEGARLGPVFAGLMFTLLQLGVAVLGSNDFAEAVYLVSILWHLGGAAMGFVFLIWSDRHADVGRAVQRSDP